MPRGCSVCKGFFLCDMDFLWESIPIEDKVDYDYKSLFSKTESVSLQGCPLWRPIVRCARGLFVRYGFPPFPEELVSIARY